MVTFDSTAGTPPQATGAGAAGAASFGRAMLSHWRLDPQAVYLNHGTVGVTPRLVLQAQQALRDEIEQHPARFMLRELAQVEARADGQDTRMRRAAAAVGAWLGLGDGPDHGADNLVFVDNASAGSNAVLRSLALHAGDEIVLFDQAYGAVARTAAFVARQHGAVVRTLTLPFPLSDPGTCLEVLAAGLTPRTRLVILDHISSGTALVMPLAAMAALCRSRGVPVLADGAHAPGAIALDIPALGVDWYTANLHKWAFAPRGCGVLWAAPQHRPALHPAVISWGLDQGWQHEFDWTGTRDPTPFLCAPDGMSFITDVLGEAAMRRWNHELAWRAAQTLCERWDQAWTTPESMIGCMATLPLPHRLGSGAAAATRLKDHLLFGHQIEVPVISLADRLYLRLSAQVYNDDSDIERLAQAVDACG
jgi:isopenicillin-N epimerase